MIARAVCRPVLRDVARPPQDWKWGQQSDLPALDPGEFFLTDDSGNYLRDENGELLTGTNT